MAESFEKRGADCPVVALINSNVPLRAVLDVPGEASKVGFKNIRVFAFESEQGYMSEITLGKGVPYSTAPAN